MPRRGLDLDVARTLEEVGAGLGLTRERIRQVEEMALAKLRCALIIDEALGEKASPRVLAALRGKQLRYFEAVASRYERAKGVDVEVITRAQERATTFHVDRIERRRSASRRWVVKNAAEILGGVHAQEDPHARR